MSQKFRDRLLVQARFEEEVTADRAELTLVISGRSVFSGREALKRAAEVVEVVQMLREFGIEEADVQLRDVVAETQKGVLTSSSSARYTLRVTCRDLNKLADIMVAVTAPKHTSMTDLTWRFPEDPEAEERRLSRALERANRKADIVAKALRVPIEGVWEVSFDEQTALDYPQPIALAAATVPTRGAPTVEETLDMSVVQTRIAAVNVRVAYRVGSRE